MNIVETPLLEKLAAAEFGPREALTLRRHLSVTPESRKELRDMLSNFDSALAPHLPQGEVQVRHGAFLWACGEAQEASRVLKDQGLNHTAGFLSAMIKMEAGDYQAASDLFAQSASAAADASADLAAQAECLLKLGMNDQAANIIENAAKKFPDAPEIKYVQGLLAEAEGDQQQALDHYESALAGNPQLPGANFRASSPGEGCPR